MEPFSTLALKSLTWVFATTTKICTIGGSRQDHSLIPFNATDTTLLHVETYESFMITKCFNGKVWVQHSSCFHFQGDALRQVSCYTLLRWFRLPWPHPCCLQRVTPFMGSHECSTSDYFSSLISATLTLLSVHPASPVLLTKNGPLSAQLIQNSCGISQVCRTSHPFKVWE